MKDSKAHRGEPDSSLSTLHFEKKRWQQRNVAIEDTESIKNIFILFFFFKQTSRKLGQNLSIQNFNVKWTNSYPLRGHLGP